MPRPSLSHTPKTGPWVYPAAPQPSAGASPDVVPGALPGTSPPPVGTPPGGGLAIAGATPAAGTGETSPRSEALSHFAGPGSPPVGGWMDKVLSKANGGSAVGGGSAADASAASSTTKAAVVEVAEDAPAPAPPAPAPPAPPAPAPTPAPHSGSHKRYCLHRAPPLLTLHLKRFERDGRGRLRKLNGHVAFPLTLDGRATLPVQQHQPAAAEGGGKAKAKGAAASPPPPPPPAGPPPTYDLVGVVEHLGSMRGGHYVAYVRRDGGGGSGSAGGSGGGSGGSSRKAGKAGDDAPTTAWYRASDTHVAAVGVKDVLACEAYLLLYARREDDV
jgi:hypothetical protein